MNENISKIEKIIETLDNKESRFYIFVPEISTPNSSVNELYVHATTLKKLGYDVTVVTEEDEFSKPFYVESHLTDVKHVHLNKEINIAPQDFLIIPEVFTNVMERVKKFTCGKILLVQSIDYALHSLIPAVQWIDFGISHVITVSEHSKAIIHEFFAENYDVEVYNTGVSDLFDSGKVLKMPIVSFVTRNGNDISDVVKLFYLKYPQFRFLTFQDLSGLDKETYAKKLKESFACIWIDNIATHGTVPLECMKANTIPIGMMPRIKHDYIKDYTGVWLDDLYRMPDMIATLLTKFLEDEIPTSFKVKMSEVVAERTMADAEKQLAEIYGRFIVKRIDRFKELLEIEKKEVSEEV